MSRPKEPGVYTTASPLSPEFSADVAPAYRQAGFILKRGAVQPFVLTKLRRYVGEVERLDPAPQMLDVYYEQSSRDGRRMVRQIENVCSIHPSLHHFTEGWLRTWAGVLLGAEAVLFKDKVNYKYPGGGGYPAHRDGRFWWRCPRTDELRRGWDYYAGEFINAAVFLDSADAANGCIELVRCRHTESAVGPEYGELDDVGASTMHFETIPTAAGDVLFFDALTPHRSGPNKSENSRCVLYLTYNRLSEGDHREAYFRDKRLSLAAQGGAQANR